VIQDINKITIELTSPKEDQWGIVSIHQEGSSNLGQQQEIHINSLIWEAYLIFIFIHITQLQDKFFSDEDNASLSLIELIKEQIGVITNLVKMSNYPLDSSLLNVDLKTNLENLAAQFKNLLELERKIRKESYSIFK